MRRASQQGYALADERFAHGIIPPMSMEKGSSGEHRKASERQHIARAHSDGDHSYFEKEVAPNPEQQVKSRRQAQRIRLTDSAHTLVDQIMEETLALPPVAKRDRLPSVAALEKDLGKAPSTELADYALTLAMEMDTPKDKALALLKAGYIRIHTDPTSAEELFQEVRTFVQTHRFDADPERDSKEKVWLASGVARAFVRVGAIQQAQEVVGQDINSHAPEKKLDTLLMLAEEFHLKQKETSEFDVIGNPLLRTACDEIIAFDDRAQELLEQEDGAVDALFFYHTYHSQTVRKAAELSIQAGDLQGAKMLIPRIPSPHERIQAMRSLSQAYASHGWVTESLSVIMNQIELAEFTNQADTQKFRDEQLRMAISRLSRNGHYQKAYGLVELLGEEKKTPRLKEIFVQLAEGEVDEFPDAIEQLETRNALTEKAELLATLTDSFIKVLEQHNPEEKNESVSSSLGEEMHSLASQIAELTDPRDKANALLFLSQAEADLFPRETALLSQAEAVDLTAIQDNERNLIWMELARAQAKAGKTRESLGSFSHISPLYKPSQWSALLRALPLDDQMVRTTLASYLDQNDPERSQQRMVAIAKEQASRGEDCFFALDEAYKRTASITNPTVKIQALSEIARLAIASGESVQTIQSLSRQDRERIINSGVPGIADALNRLHPEIED